MAEEKKYRIGDFEFKHTPGKNGAYLIAYMGPTGPGSETTLPANVDIEGDDCWIEDRAVYKGINVEKLISKQRTNAYDMPILKTLIVSDEKPSWYCPVFENCPKLSLVVFECQTKEAADISKCKNEGSITIEYQQGIEDLDQVVAGDNIHAVFGDGVEDVGVIRGGHVTLGKDVKRIRAIKKADMGLNADTTVKEYELPTRIDFTTATPPQVLSVTPGALTVAELHVPAGALDAYTAHPQWGKAAYFVDADGKVIDKYAAKHKARMKKVEAERKEKEAKESEHAKKEKLHNMGKVLHPTLGLQRLAKWSVTVNGSRFYAHVQDYTLEIIVPTSAPVEIWDKIVAKVEEIEAKLQ